VALHRSAVGHGGAVEVLCRGDGCVHRTLTVSGLTALLDVHIVRAPRRLSEATPAAPTAQS
jgi:hypothetical protein